MKYKEIALDLLLTTLHVVRAEKIMAKWAPFCALAFILSYQLCQDVLFYINYAMCKFF
jgi:hypothetical protein